MVELRRILCPVDLSDQSRHALTYALRLAALYDARVTVLHVGSVGAALAALPTTADVNPRTFWSTDPAVVVPQLTLFAALEPSDAARVQFRASAGSAWHAILDEASATTADLVVLGTHGRSGFERLLLGSVAHKVVAKAAVPVLTVPPAPPTSIVGPQGEFSRVLCAVDFSEPSLRALAHAASVAEKSGATLLVLHVFETPDVAAECPDLDTDTEWETFRYATCRRLQDAIPECMRARSTVQTMKSHGGPYRTILHVAEAEFADLIVLGRHGRGAVLQWLLGSTTEQVLRHAACPVLTVPAVRSS